MYLYTGGLSPYSTYLHTYKLSRNSYRYKENGQNKMAKITLVKAQTSSAD